MIVLSIRDTGQQYYIFIWWSRNLPGRGWDRLRQWTIFWPLDPWWGRQCPQEQPPPRLCCTIYWKSPAFFADAQSKPTCCLSTQLKLICLKQYQKSNNKSAILESLPGTYIIYLARCLKITENVSFIIASEVSYAYILGSSLKILKWPKMVEFSKTPS